MLLAGLVSATPVAADEPPPSGLGATDRGRTVEFWKAGGPAVKVAAEAALTGSDQDVRQFLDSGRAAAEYQDDKEAALQIIAQAGPGLRKAAEAAVAGTPQDLDAFVKEGWKTPLQQDEAVEATRITDAGGPGVKQAGDAALNGSVAQLEDFLNRVQFQQRDTDDLVRVTQIESAGGPAVKQAASLAMNGTAEDVREFLAVGQYIARANDQEFATISQLTDEVNAAGLRAEQESVASKEASEQAVSAARLAKEAAAVAAAESKAAQNDASRAAEANRRAAEATLRAADAARAAVTSSRAANSAARAAASAAADASAAAANAAQATAKALSAAAAGVVDENAIKGALFAAQLSGAAAKAADKASRAASAVAQMEKTAQDISADVNAAILSANEAGGYAVQAGLSSVETTAAAGAARRYSQESTRAAKAAAALAGEAGLAAAAARDAANSAAARASAAADAASKAGSHAGDAAQATEQARIHSEAAQAASDAATSAVEKAKTVYDLARKTEAEEVTARTNAGRNEAEDLTSAHSAAQTESARVQSEAKKLDEDFTHLATQAGQPGTDLQQVVTTGRKMAVTAMKISGPWSRAAAEYALAGSDSAMADYARTGWQNAQHQDEGDQARSLAAASPYEAVRTAAAEAFKGDAARIHTFLESGQYEAASTEYLIDVTRISQAGGPGVRQAGDAAINAGAPRALVDFLTVTQYQARETDDRVVAARLSQNGGPEVRAAAEAAIVSPPNALRAFIDSGQYRAERQDQLNAVHAAQIQQAIAEATDVAARAHQSAAQAAQAYAVARNATAEANGYAQQAQNDADQAAASARQAQVSAQQAKQSADKAATAAKTANKARQQAASSANSAASSATTARASVAAAFDSAGKAYDAATAARQSAERAGKDAQTLTDIFNTTLGQYRKEREEYQALLDQNAFFARWHAYTYQNLPPITKGIIAFNSLPLRQKAEFALDLAHTGADIFGALPVVGTPVSLANCGMYFMEGQLGGGADKYKDAALACAGTIPLGGLPGLGAKLEKWGAKYEKLSTGLQNLWTKAEGAPLPFCPTRTLNSFPAGTRVLMGDGSTRPIETIRTGDQVMATDPVSTVTGPQNVEATIFTPDDRDFTDLTVTTADGTTSAVTSTDHHPFWSENQRTWRAAADLTAADSLRTAEGLPLQISAVRHWKSLQPAYNLTVSTSHTYYVLAGGIPVLVHNDDKYLCVDGDHLVLGINPFSDRLKDTLKARTYNGGSYGDPYPNGDGRPIWMVGVENALGNPNVKISVTLDGVPGAEDPDQALKMLVERGRPLIGPNWKVAAAKTNGTSWEMAVLRLKVVLGKRKWNSIEWYWGGRNVTEKMTVPDWAQD
ncbi:polymorphic toxin type 27 domain-containing protein [Kitasatospora sp. NPDC059973]|uniref:polymorphic toxin type 27 domain-containing protein n=1 Tax=Kitasatospora sp. NPDC059973 TaxID=3347020 RepID=UPI00367DD459